MANEAPLLEYARSSDGREDRYRRTFLLAGVLGVAILTMPSGDGPSLGGEIFEVAGYAITRWRDPSTPLGRWFAIWFLGVCGGLLSPLTLLLWRVVRLKGADTPAAIGVLGLVLASIHALAAVAVTTAPIVHGREGWIISTGASIPLALLGWLACRAFRRMTLSASVLLVLLCSWISCCGLFIAVALVQPPTTRWVLVAFPLAGLIALIEFLHVLRNNRRGARRPQDPPPMASPAPIAEVAETPPASR
jgi:hypothetical protein